ELAGARSLVAEASLDALLGVVVAELLYAFAEAPGLLGADGRCLAVAEAAQAGIRGERVAIALAFGEAPARQVAGVLERFVHRGLHPGLVVDEQIAGQADDGRDVAVAQAVGGGRRPALQEG